MGRDASKIIDGKVCLTTSEIAKVMGVEDRTIQQWGDKGCPKAGRGWWAIGDVLRWRGLVGEGPDNSDEKISWSQLKMEYEAKFKEQKAEEAALKNAVSKGEYIKKTDITSELQRFFVTLKMSMTGFSRMIATELSAYVDVLTARKIEKMISEVTIDALEQISINGIYEASKIKKRKD